MATKIRLSRRGRKNLPHYAIVIADSRSPRDGKFIEKIGFFSPLHKKDDPKRMKIDFKRANFWLSQGAIPTDTIMNIFSKVKDIDMPKKYTNMITGRMKLFSKKNEIEEKIEKSK